MNCVNVVLSKCKVGVNFKAFRGSRSFQKQTNFMETARSELVGLAFYIMQIGPMEAMLETLKERKVSTQLPVSQGFGDILIIIT